MSLPRLRAPKEHGQILAVPPLDQVDAVFLEPIRRDDAKARQIRTQGQYPFISAAQMDARHEVTAASTHYHQEAGEEIPAPTGQFWFVAGHQPELFHPGVWIKNFALHQLARKHGGSALNLIIDTDTASPALLHAPSEGRLARIPFDRSTAETPYEERNVEDERLFADLPERMKPILSNWSFEPMLASFWDEVMKQAKRTSLLGERFAAARRAVERRWGMTPREVPMSRVCQTEAFAQFALWILGDLAAFHSAYNQVVGEYRREHGIRSRSHPFPDLAQNGDWLEAPFWAWRRGQGRRGRLFVRDTPHHLDLRVADEDWPNLPKDGRSPHEAYRTLEARGFKIRSRALTTTMFARLLLADVFVHGIGGGIYDTLTDRIVAKLRGSPPSPFLVLSATLLLPLPRFPEAVQVERVLERRQRDLVFKPEHFLEHSGEAAPLIRAKVGWISRTGATHAERVERFQRIRDLNAGMLPLVHAQLEQTQRSLANARRQAEWDAVAGRRDYAFCLYPEEMLRNFYSAALKW